MASSCKCSFEVKRAHTVRLKSPWIIPALALALAACDGPAPVSGPPAPVSGSQEAPVLVRLGRFEKGEISDKLAVAADLEAVARADVPPEISGVVAEVLRREGDRVTRGEPVLRLIDAPLRLLMEQKRILSTQARSKVELADAQAREGAEIVKQKKLLLAKARAEYDRVRGLAEDLKNGIISREEADSKRYSFEQAEVDLSAALIQAEKNALEHTQAIESEKLAKVELQTAEYNHSQTTLRSPIDGSISYLQVKPGELLSTTAKAFSVVDTSRLEARLHVPQRELARLRKGQKVRILCEVFADREFSGEIEVVSPVVDKLNGTVEVLVGVTDRSGFLRPGMFVNGEIIVDTRAEAVLVTKKAITYENQEPIVYLVKDHVARRCVLRPGYSTKTHVEVLELLGTDGERVDPTSGELVEIGHNNLKEGSRVEIDSAGSGPRTAAREAAPQAGKAGS